MRLVRQADLTAGRRAIKGVVSGGLLLGLLILFLVPPANLPVPGCAFHSITGHSCLTCGMTRSLHAIVHGNLAASVRYHMFGPVVFLGLLFCFAVFAMEAFGGNSVVICVEKKVRSRVIGAFAVLWFVYWGCRLTLEFLV